jgi:hypothetical protein
MTLTARGRDVYFGNQRLGIGSRQDVMTVMTISTHSRTLISLGDSFCMDTLLIRKKWTIADPASLHDRFVTMAASACFGNVGPINS